MAGSRSLKDPTLGQRLKAAWSMLGGRSPFTGPNPMNGIVQLFGGSIVVMADDQKTYVKDGYSANDIVYSIINMITNKVKVAPWGVYNIKDEQALAKYKGLVAQGFTVKKGGYKQVIDARHKALQPIKTNDKLTDLLKYPNQNDSWSDFIEQATGFKLITGNKFIYSITLQGGVNKGKPQELHVLPSQYMYILNDGNFPASVKGYEIFYGAILPLAKEQIMHEKYWNPDWNVYGNQLYGMSPLKAALLNVQRSNDAKNAALASFQNMGAKGVLYLDDERLPAAVTAEQTSALKRAYQKEYTGTDNFNKAIISGYKVGWEQVGLSPVDLAIIESEKWDMRALCNIYGVPSELMNDPDNKSFNNKEQAEKALTTRCALPLLISHRDSFNRKLQTDWGYKGSNLYVDFDMSVYTELQDDLGDTAEWLNTAWWLTPNQKNTAMNYELSTDPNMNKIYIPNTFIPLEEVNMLPEMPAEPGKPGKPGNQQQDDQDDEND